MISLLGVTKEELGDRIAQFYTDLNIDGRFIALSDQTWGFATGIRTISWTKKHSRL